MSLQSEIDRLNNTVASQASLLSQIQTALEGKSAGGGSSGGGTSVETCTVMIKNGDTSCEYDGPCIATCLDENGEFTSYVDAPSGPQYTFDLTIENVVCNTPIYVKAYGWDANDWTITGPGVIVQTIVNGVVFKVTEPGASVLFTLYGSD